MNVVHEDVKQCVENELQHAVSVFGLHHSQHEKICVIAEEFEESAETLDALKGKMLNAWAMVKSNTDSDMMDDAYGRIYEEAVHLACEAIQVAAMATKPIATQEADAKWQVSCDGYYPYCPICGARPDKKTMFCAECGAKLGE